MKYISAILFSIFLLSPSLVSAGLPVNPAFNPDKIIDDAVFSDTKTFGGASGIQKFLESKGSILANANPDFLAKLKEPQISLLKQGLEDPQPNLPRLRTAAELIWDASVQSGLNPQVIIVTLQKEQSLITGRQTSTPEQLQRALDFSLGFGCPDSGGCGAVFTGFYHQLFGNFDSEGSRYLGAARSLMKSFNTPGGRGPMFNGSVSRVGSVITLDNTEGAYDGIMRQQSITLGNSATAALYNYTPHIFNGNYNFWKYFNEWFRYPNNTLFKLANDTKIYIILNGVKQPVPQFVIIARGLNPSSAITVSQTEFESYVTDKLLGPVDNTVIKVEGENGYYVFQNNLKLPATSVVIAQRGLNVANALNVSALDAALFEKGPQLTPNDGTVLRGKTNHAVYLVSGGFLQLFSGYTFAQHGASKRMQIIDDSELESYPKKGFVAPLDGTIIKASNSQAVYVTDKGQKRPMSGEVFRSRNIVPKQIAVLSSEEVDGISLGVWATPKEQSFYTVGSTGQLWLFKDGSKHSISNFVKGQRKITPDFTFSQSEHDAWPVGPGITPRDNTLVKGDGSGAVYVVLKSQLRLLSAAAFKARKYSFKNVVTLPQVEVDGYSQGEVLLK